MTHTIPSAPAPTEAATMRAAVQRQYGPVAAITVERVPRPTLKADQVLIQVHAAGVDRGAWHLATGRPYIMRVLGFGLRRPRQPIMGSEVAGVVVETGTAVTKFQVGDAVFGSANGAYAQFTVANESEIALAPTSLTLAESATAGVSGVAALRAVEDVAKVSAGQRVLILGASGGVGSYAAQLAIAAGAHVTGVASAEKLDLVRRLGVAEVIDYRATDVTTTAQQYDAIIDTGGLTPLRRLRRILAPAGTLVIVGGEGGGSVTGGAGRQLRAGLLSLVVRQKLAGLLSTTTVEALERLRAHLDAGAVRPALTSTYPLDHPADALVDAAAGRIAGKAVVTVVTDH